MKKRNRYGLVTAAAVIGLAMPFTIKNVDYPLSRTAIVQAATKRITLKHNAYVYNHRGRRVGRSKLYRNHSYRYYSVKYIHGKKYYRVGRNRYVKAANKISGNSSSSKNTINTNGMGTPKFQVKIDKDNVDIYNASHSTANGSWLTAMSLHGTYNVYAEDNDMYEIGKDQWIDEDDADSVVQSNSNTTKTNQSSKKKSKNTDNGMDLPQNGHFTEAEIQDIRERFVAQVNKAREAQGKEPLTLDAECNAVASKRVIHDANTIIATGDEDNHMDSNGNSLVPDDMAEVETKVVGGTTKEVADFAYKSFMFWDAGANWKHKKILLSDDYTRIGLSSYFAGGLEKNGSLVADLK